MFRCFRLIGHFRLRRGWGVNIVRWEGEGDALIYYLFVIKKDNTIFVLSKVYVSFEIRGMILEKR